MRKTLKRQALEYIAESMEEVKMNFLNYGEPEYLEANSKAMKNLAMAYTLVKRGVMLPDDGREFKETVFSMLKNTAKLGLLMPILPYTLTERRGRRSGKNTLDILSVANANTGMNRKKMKTKETDLHFALVVVGHDRRSLART